MNTRKSVNLAAAIAIGTAACALAVSAQAMVVNGSFETTIARSTNNNGSGMLATSANITGPATTPITLSGWNTTRDGIGCVTFPGTYVNNVCGPDRFAGSGFAAGGPGSSPDGGNFILIDGDRSVTTALYQTINGLVVGDFYTVTFFQAAARFLDASATGPTTERWDVSLGGDATNLTAIGNFATGVHQLSDLMNTPAGSFHAWQSQSLTFQVTDSSLAPGSVTSQILGFFAVGTPPAGQPPIVLLDGIRLTPVRETAIPEPQSLALLALALIGGTLVSCNRRTRSTGA